MLTVTSMDWSLPSEMPVKKLNVDIAMHNVTKQDFIEMFPSISYYYS